MPDVVLTAIITGFFSIVAAFIAARATSNKMMTEMRINQAVTNTKIDALAGDVRKHNNFAERMPAIEEQVRGIDERLKTLERKAG